MTGAKRVWLAAAIATACGGKVTVEGTTAGSGGAGTSSSSDQATGGPASSSIGPQSSGGPGATTGMTSAQTGPMMDPCSVVCSTVKSCAGVNDCYNTCKSVNPMCNAQHQQWLACLAQHGWAQPCPSVPECNGALMTYLICAGEKGDSSGGSGDPNGACTWKWTAGGHTYSDQCAPSGNAQYICQCFLDGAFFGKCIAPSSPDAACPVGSTCCMPLFFVNH